MTNIDLDTEDPLFNFHFDFHYTTEPGLYSHENNDYCDGHIVTKSGYRLFCIRCGSEVSADE